MAVAREEQLIAEGAISLHQGGNQIEVSAGVVVREKMTPVLSGGLYHINNSTLPTSLLKNRKRALIGIYHNSVNETRKWTRVVDSNAFGTARFTIPQANLDLAKDEVTVSYLVLDRHLFTSNPTEFIAQYNNNLRSVVSDLSQQQSDLATRVSINNNEIIKILARLKAGGIA